jgi:hypothetical protein
VTRISTQERTHARNRNSKDTDTKLEHSVGARTQALPETGRRLTCHKQRQRQHSFVHTRHTQRSTNKDQPSLRSVLNPDDLRLVLMSRQKDATPRQRPMNKHAHNFASWLTAPWRVKGTPLRLFLLDGRGSLLAPADRRPIVKTGALRWAYFLHARTAPAARLHT